MLLQIALQCWTGRGNSGDCADDSGNMQLGYASRARPHGSGAAAQVLKTLKFGIGDGRLRYYLYNWRVPAELQPSDVGLVLL